MKQYRQGDVLIVKIDSIPANAKSVKSKVVAEGEGHHEHVVTDDVEVLEVDGTLYLAVNESGQLEHVTKGTRSKAEHNAVSLEKGYYKVVLQQEYDPYEDLIRQVRD